MIKIAAMIKALYYGQELTSKVTWKKRQILINSLMIVLSSVWVILGLEVSEDKTQAIVGGIIALWGVLDTYLVVATSSTVGLSGNTTAGS